MANIFNAAQYLALYPAIADYGYNEANAWDHFVQYGAAELRTPNDELKGKVYAESVLNYANGNPELAEYFGVVVPAESLTAAQQGELLLHYVMYGNAEDRANKIIDAPAQSEDADLTELKEALEAVVAADADLKAAEKAAADALDEGLEKSYEDASTALDDDIPGFSGVESAEVRTQLIEAKQAQLAAVAQQAATALGKNKGLVDAYLNAQNRLIDLSEAKDEAELDAAAEGAKAGLLLGEKSADTDGYNEELNSYTLAGVEFKIGANGKVVFADDADADTVKAIKELSNYDALVQQLQTNAALNSQLEGLAKVYETAGDRLVAAELATKEVDDESIEFTLVGAAAGYEAAHDDVTEFNKLVAEFRKVEAYKNSVDAAQEAYDVAVEALEDLGYTINDTEFGTPDNDLFVYGNEDATVYSFGEQGEDLFFFGDFAFVELKANDNFATGSFGDRNTLEIFAQQQGTDVVLYVEINEVGGNAFGIDDNVNTITLVGVNLEDLSFDSGAGFLVG